MGSIKIFGEMPLLFLLISLMSLELSEQCDPTPQPPPPPPAGACQFDQWGQWSVCSATCGGGQRARVRTATIHSLCNGPPCAGDVTSFEVCNTNACEACDEVIAEQEFDAGKWELINGEPPKWEFQCENAICQTSK